MNEFIQQPLYYTMIWTSIFKDLQQISPDDQSFVKKIPAPIPKGVKRLRLQCRPRSESIFAEVDIESRFQEYIDHPWVDEAKSQIIRENFRESFSRKIHKNWSLLVFDNEGRFRGRWDPSFSDWKEIGEYESSCGFEDGLIGEGVWHFHLSTTTKKVSTQIQIDIEAALDVPENGASCYKKPLHLFEADANADNQLAWRLGELHEHSLRSAGRFTPEDTLSIYQEIGYNFLALTDHDAPPLKALQRSFSIAVLRGQEIRWPFGHALLLGMRDWMPPNADENPDHVGELIHETHVQGGLFGILHPFAIQAGKGESLWTIDSLNWGKVDLLEIWSGSWRQRFPEILKSFDLWDKLLNRGHHIFGFCGKGSGEPANAEILEQSPKTAVLSEGLSEGSLLSALKLGHFYATCEPAISLHIESDYGEAFMGDELHLPANKPFVLYITISQLDGAYLRIKTNQGIYCEMPASSKKETQLKFYERAGNEPRWFRVEIYRYGRPVDDLLAFSNPIFVRPLSSVQ
ncbi:MAG: CehA/McbA family metallohydrolase [Candidatus Omnitrophica bacterium]|nr:CehA/McbA family metallohydrolase [Candidatus Omnitrophota bacterium]